MNDPDDLSAGIDLYAPADEMLVAAWRRGVEDSLAKVRWRRREMAGVQQPAYAQALADIETHLLAMLERGTARSTTPVAGEEES